MPTRIDLRHLRYFVAVAEELSFSQAAVRLHITQPALSESIRELEAVLGAELLVRSSRHVALTWPGALLLDEARRILRLVRDTVTLARAAAGGDKATLRVGVVEDRQPGILSKAFARCRHLLPELRLVLHTLPTGQQLRALRDHRLDLGVLIGPVEGDDLAVEELWTEPLVAALPREHALAGRPTLALASLRGEPFILPDVGLAPGYHARILALCRAAGFVPKVAERAFHWDGWLGLTAAGFGVALLPASLDTTHLPQIVTLRLADAGATIPLAAAWRRTDAPSPVLPAVVAALRGSRTATNAMSLLAVSSR